MTLNADTVREFASAENLNEALLYENAEEQAGICNLCAHRCYIPVGQIGICKVKENRAGRLYSLVYDRIISVNIDPIEKKPLHHFLPSTRSYSFATVGCNFHCRFCQNWDISQMPRDYKGVILGQKARPKEIVCRALAARCKTISYTYTEPTIFFELAYDTAKLAAEAGLKNIFVTNGFISEAPLRELATVLDAANVDLKFLKPESYRRISRARLEPILDAIRLYRALGVWVEVTTLVIPGVNDTDDELKAIAAFVASVGPEVPWHVSQFYPAWKMLDRPVTAVETLRRAAAIGRQAGLRYVYEGNVPGEKGENTWCPGCGALLIERYGHHVRGNRIRQGACPDCGTRIDGVDMSARG